ncbi:plasma membrane fusion protein prm1 [Globomyces sp. JEL0801]|nr:plasma membrane fusion protein prm1 [Globomyces sp. JEL0801]
MNPQLSLKAKLSRSYLNQTTIPLLICLWVLFIISQILDREGATARQELQQSCKGIEITANSLASTPMFIANGFNRQMTSIIKGSEKQSIQLIIFTMTLIKKLILYILFRYQRVMECVLFLSLSAGANMVSQSAADVTKFVNVQMADISRELNSGLDGINSKLKGISDQTSKINVLGKSLDLGISEVLPVRFPGVTDKLHMKLPDSLEQSLKNFKVPTLDELEKKVGDLLSTPFDDLTKKMTNAITVKFEESDIKFKKQIDILPVPKPVTSIQFCDTILPTKTVDKVVDALKQGTNYGLICIAIAIFGSLVYYSIFIYFRHRNDRNRVKIIQEQVRSTSSFPKTNQEMTAKQIYFSVKHPLVYDIVNGERLKRFLGKRSIARLQWFLTYISDPIAWMCILIGIFGIITLKLQLVLIEGAFKKVYPILKDDLQTVTSSIMGKMNSALDNSIGPYLKEMNQQVDLIQESINGIMGDFVNETVEIVDRSIATIFSSFNKEMENILGPVPPLKNALESFGTCVIGNSSWLNSDTIQILKNQTRINISRPGQEDFQLSVSQLMNLTNTILRFDQLESKSTETATLYFSNILNNLKSRYESTIRYQIIPFQLSLVIGLSLIVFGAIRCLRDIIFNK